MEVIILTLLRSELCLTKASRTDLYTCFVPIHAILPPIQVFVCISLHRKSLQLKLLNLVVIRNNLTPQSYFFYPFKAGNSNFIVQIYPFL